ncbi:MAG: DUF4432 family protein [Bacteroidia bacterium]|nr:MAG: DUF4432 family protein [Bacteroidia bacterium]
MGPPAEEDGTHFGLHGNFNWGSPLFSSASLLKIEAESTEVRNKNVEADIWKTFMEPRRSFEEQVYLHRLKPGPENKAGYELFNPELKLGVRAEWDMAPLPCFTQWLMCGEGEYVLGLEPGNFFPTGRVSERKHKRLEFLAANSEKEVSLSVEILDHEKISGQPQRKA